MRVNDQNIPSELAEKYDATLQRATAWKTGERLQKRCGFEYPSRQGNGLITPDEMIGTNVSEAQWLVRRHFARSVYFWRLQPQTGGATPPDFGPRARTWWYTDAIGSGLWYYDYYIQQTMNAFLADTVPDWCKLLLENFVQVSEFNPTTNYATNLVMNAANTAIAGKYWVYAKTPGDAEYIWLRWGYYSGPSVPPNTIKVEIYETVDTWDVNTITWNNKPAVGNKIGEISITGLVGYESYPVTGVDAVVLKIQQPECTLGWFSKNYGLASVRPFTYPFEEV